MYQQSIDRRNPGCFFFLLDQSNSMMDGIRGSAMPKAQALANVINRLFNGLIIDCDKGEDKIRHYFDIGLIGYTTDEDGINPVFRSFAHEALSGRELVS